jgi:hypothetical protein
MAEPVNVNDLLDGHVALDLECLDRVYLNAYVPNLQVSGQVVTFSAASKTTSTTPSGHGAGPTSPGCVPPRARSAGSSTSDR